MAIKPELVAALAITASTAACKGSEAAITPDQCAWIAAGIAAIAIVTRLRSRHSSVSQERECLDLLDQIKSQVGDSRIWDGLWVQPGLEEFPTQGYRIISDNLSPNSEEPITSAYQTPPNSILCGNRIYQRQPDMPDTEKIYRKIASQQGINLSASGATLQYGPHGQPEIKVGDEYSDKNFQNQSTGIRNSPSGLRPSRYAKGPDNNYTPVTTSYDCSDGYRKSHSQINPDYSLVGNDVSYSNGVRKTAITMIEQTLFFQDGRKIYYRNSPSDPFSVYQR